ncbi:MAG: FAD-binding oxidoreductase [Tepidimonas sp.]|uniref:NAD(P)/FAD-dependent oxidoreductase n=1 Tax=Tepidimonas sp. TaxID=2002775 RepID=UPI00259DC910|nr:FAD-binding oxidoreductase [Tepidimonas sp.]MDM7456812.1 FAD-binding oxidoreductase [Tepidimonas sp.]
MPTRLLQADALLGRENYYEYTTQRPPALPPLQGNVRADVVVVGAGLAGLSVALELAERGRRVVVLEAGRIGASASGRNGGQAIVGYASGMGPLERQLGRALARQAWLWSLEGVNLIEQRIQRYGIDCDWRRGYVYVADRPRKARQLRAEMDQLARDYDFSTEWAEGAALRAWVDSPRYVAAAHERVSGHLHPLKYTVGLAQAAIQSGAVLYENSAVRQLQHASSGVSAVTDRGEVRADIAVVAGNCLLPEWGPGVLPSIHARVMPVGTYIVATEPLPPHRAAALIPSGAAVSDNNVVLDYFRLSADHRLLFGGRVSYTTKTPMRLRETMRRRMQAVFPQLQDVRLTHLWGGFVDITMDRAPDFGRVGNRIYYLQGFSGHGLALTGLAGRVVAEAVCAQTERWDVYARLRHWSFPGGRWLRTPLLALGMAWHRLKDWV